MDIIIEFVVCDPKENTLTPAPNLTLTSEDGIIMPPSVGDLVPIKGTTYRVYQRAYVIERSATIIGKKSLVYSCILVPVEVQEVQEVKENADEK